jgi:hypothetical protein
MVILAISVLIAISSERHVPGAHRLKGPWSPCPRDWRSRRRFPNASRRQNRNSIFVINTIAPFVNFASAWPAQFLMISVPMPFSV